MRHTKTHKEPLPRHIGGSDSELSMNLKLHYNAGTSAIKYPCGYKISPYTSLISNARRGQASFTNTTSDNQRTRSRLSFLPATVRYIKFALLDEHGPTGFQQEALVFVSLLFICGAALLAFGTIDSVVDAVLKVVGL